VTTHAKSPSPAFGQADLSNCEREQIHLAGSIQPHGVLLVLSEPELRIVQASQNAGRELHSDAIVGKALEDIPGDLAASVRSIADQAIDHIPSSVRCRVGQPASDFDGLLHRPPSGGLVLELERAGPAVDLTEDLERDLQAIRQASSLQQLADEAASIFRRIAGYDRAMVYQFDEEGHGEVISERRRPDLESYFGQRYPASDIPQMARHLYIRNRVRVLVDVHDDRIPIEPQRSPITDEDLDMSLCSLRAMSPIHIQYLKNMGVAATLVASLVVGGRLWGLVSCHHYSRRIVHYETRVVCELLAEAIATRIAALESFAQAQAELAVRRLEQQIAKVISKDGDWRTAIFDGSRSIMKAVGATGAALLFEGEVQAMGEVPGTQTLRALGRWLDERERESVFATASLGLDEPRFESIGDSASGLVAAPVSNTPGEYLLWFRPAQERVVTWGGNPTKPFVVGDDPADLSPRRSFAQWRQQVKGTSAPWKSADLGAAKLIGEMLSGIILQFRSVQFLIAQNQVESVRGQVGDAGHPVVVADADGRVLLTNHAFENLVSASHSNLERIGDVAALFAHPDDLTSLFADMVQKHRSFRGEFDIISADGARRPLLVRGDPVLASPTRLLGFVILASDLSEQKEVDAARRRLQETLVADHPLELFGDRRDATYQHLLASMLGNAQLAALEITDGVDATRMPDMLESVRVSLDRTTELLEHLVSYAARISKRKE
jgi:PAS domain S-box-containing protein